MIHLALLVASVLFLGWVAVWLIAIVVAVLRYLFEEVSLKNFTTGVAVVIVVAFAIFIIAAFGGRL